MRRARTFETVLTLAGLAALSPLVQPAPAAAQATVTVVNLDLPGKGFNDTSPADPDSTAGGNSGATLGEQRLNAFEFAAAVWGNTLESPAEIRVGADWDDTLYCDASKAALGGAGANYLGRDFDGAPLAQTYYPAALVCKLVGYDLLDPTLQHIGASFNPKVGTTCPFPQKWYYGLDGKPPAGKIDFVTTVVHELAHGLGFQTYVNLATGKKLAIPPPGDDSQPRDDVFMTFLEDHSLGLRFPAMSDTQRKAAIIDTGDLHWVGANVVAGGVLLTAGRSQPSGHVEMYAPNPYEVGSSLSHFAKTLLPNEAMEPVYIDANHNPGLARQLMQDVGWVTGTPTDLYFVVDTTGSFWDDLPVFQQAAPDIVDTLKSEGTDLKVGLGSFEDYPISPFGSASSKDLAYRQNIDLTADTDAVLSVITGLYTRYGEDTPESQLAALYQAATGAGQTVDGHPEANITAGQQAHFRDGAVKLFLLWTDAPFHRPGDLGEPPGDFPYPGPSFDATVAAIKALDPPKVIGVASGSDPGTLADVKAIAMATGGVAPEGGVDCNEDGTTDIPAGDPLVCTASITGEGVGKAMLAVVQAAQEPTAITILVRESINLRSALVTVNILGTGTFAPDQEINWKTVCFGRDAIPGVGDCTESHKRAHIGEANGDGRTDLILHYDTKETGIVKGDTQVCVTGRTYAGTALRGCTSIRPAF